MLFLPLLFGVTVQNLAMGEYAILLLYFGLTMLIQTLVAAIGIVLARERWTYLWAVPMGRLVYGPLRTYILYRSALLALRGAYVGWNKLQRTGTVDYQPPTGQPAFRPVTE
jgi:hypothetical protein